MKRVAFQERLVEFMPTPVIESLSDTEVETSSSEDDNKRRRKVIEAEDGYLMPIHGRRKRRDWVWRPVDDDTLKSHDVVSHGNNSETPPDQMQLDVANVQTNSVNEEDDEDVTSRQSSTPEYVTTN